MPDRASDKLPASNAGPITYCRRLGNLLTLFLDNDVMHM